MTCRKIKVDVDVDRIEENVYLEPEPMEHMMSPLRGLTARENEEVGTYAIPVAHTFPNSATVPPAVPPASCPGQRWTQIWLHRHAPAQPGVRSSVGAGPRRSIHICARTFVIALRAPRFRVLPKYDNLSPTYAEGARPMHARPLSAVDVRAPSARVNEDALHLAKTLKYGADVGLEGIWW
jgi:hypothetical protein